MGKSGRRDLHSQPSAWKAETLLLSYVRLGCFRTIIRTKKQPPRMEGAAVGEWRRGDSNPRAVQPIVPDTTCVSRDHSASGHLTGG